MKMRKNNTGMWLTVFAGVLFTLALVVTLNPNRLASSFFGLSDDNILVGNSAGVSSEVAVPSCDSNILARIQYTVATNSFVCEQASDLFLPGNLFVPNNFGLVIGHTTEVTFDGVTAEFQQLGTGSNDPIMLLGGYGATKPPRLWMVRGMDGTIDVATTAVTSGQGLGQIRAYGSDGTNFNHFGAAIDFTAAENWAENDVPGVMDAAVLYVPPAVAAMNGLPGMV